MQRTPTIMDWDLENENIRLERMIILYEEEIEHLETENKALKEQLAFLELQLEIKTMGLPESKENLKE